ncbi:hypothetical protein Sjap_007138 [Stephania japonica]|uniref:Pentatricopeptide repeat-containing protein n=1 Tax=Stephania japonica TaxID=461633 RepID=A0AAP0JMD0_9MAGN
MSGGHLKRFFSSDARRLVTEMISKGLFEQALRFYKEQLHPSTSYAHFSIFPSIVKASSFSADFLPFGIQLHCIALKAGTDSNSITANSFISFYSKCSRVESARRMFDEMPVRDPVTWNSMINCYITNGNWLEALEMFKLMHLLGFEWKPELVASVISICRQTWLWKPGREIHAHVVRVGIVDTSIVLSTALVDMYSRCLSLDSALRVFNSVEEKNEVSWTSIITGCSLNKCYSISLDHFRKMQMEGLKPNRVTLISVLPACGELGALKHGMQIHCYAVRRGLDTESQLSASLMDMYCRCRGGMASATLMFERFEGKKDVVMWSTMIRGYSSIEDNSRVMQLFNRMHLDGIKPNAVTLLAVIGSCASLSSSLKHCQVIHGYVVCSGLNSDVNIGNALIDMYAKCGCLQSSCHIFREMPFHDSVSYCSLIQSCGLHGYGTEALQLFHEMQERDVEIDGITFLVVLSACNHTGLVKEGQQLFKCVKQRGKIVLTVEHYACYVDLLARSGKLEEAHEVVIGMPIKPSPNIWSCLVSACRIHDRMDLGEKLVQLLVSLESDCAANYTSVSQVYAEIGDWFGVEEVTRIMRIKGLKKSCGFSRIECDHQSSTQTSV